jgi:hypothetical protein
MTNYPSCAVSVLGSRVVSGDEDVSGPMVIVSVVGASVEPSVVSGDVSGDVLGDSVVDIVSPLHAMGNVDGQLGSLGWKHASVFDELVQYNPKQTLLSSLQKLP